MTDVEFPTGDTPCPERRRLVEYVNTETGAVAGKTLVPMEHEWRLLERARKERNGIVLYYTETWYCTRCRLVETRQSK
jgi:hypothetical protein